MSNPGWDDMPSTRLPDERPKCPTCERTTERGAEGRCVTEGEFACLNRAVARWKSRAANHESNWREMCQENKRLRAELPAAERARIVRGLRDTGELLKRMASDLRADDAECRRLYSTRATEHFAIADKIERTP